MKEALISKPCLYPPDDSKEFHFFTDASKGAVGAWIGQADDQGTVHPVAYASRKLNGSQLNWSVIEKELYAVVWSVEHFMHYLYGQTVHLYSDHRPLQWLQSLSQHSPRLARWSLRLQCVDLIPHFISGNKNVVADAMSRL